MNKILPIAIVVVILLIGGLAFLMSKAAPNTPQTVATPTAQTQNSVNPEAGKSIRELMTMTANQTCTFDDEDGNTGTLYSSGGKARMDLVGSHDGETTNTHMISDGTDVYLWFEGSEEGFKMALDTIDEFETEEIPSFQAVDVNQEVDYDCSPWSVDNTKFTLPDVEFQDLSAMMEEATEAMEGAGISCEACDALPEGDAQTQCRVALKCS